MQQDLAHLARAEPAGLGRCQQLANLGGREEAEKAPAHARNAERRSGGEHAACRRRKQAGTQSREGRGENGPTEKGKLLGREHQNGMAMMAFVQGRTCLAREGLAHKPSSKQSGEDSPSRWARGDKRVSKQASKLEKSL